MTNAISTPLLTIGGRQAGATDGATFDVIAPATGELIARVPSAGQPDVDRAVAAAQAAF